MYAKSLCHRHRAAAVVRAGRRWQRLCVQVRAEATEAAPKPCKPCVILVQPQIGENIGAAARAMKNFGLSDLRIVDPRDGWPNPLATSTAANAKDVVDAATIHPTLDSAIADVSYLYAATARSRFMTKEYVVAHREFPGEVRALEAGGAHVGIMFGRENSGLTNEEVARANKILTINADPSYPVLNMGQAVVITCHALWNGGTADGDSGQRAAGAAESSAGSSVPPTPGSSNARGSAQVQRLHPGDAGTSQHAAGGSSAAFEQPWAQRQGQGQGQEQEQGSPIKKLSLSAQQRLATRGELEAYIARLFSELDAAGFFEEAGKAEACQLSIRNLYSRVGALTHHDVQLLQGMLTRLSTGGKGRGRAAAPRGEGKGGAGTEDGQRHE